MITQLRQYWPHMRLEDKTVIIIFGVSSLLSVALLIAHPSFRGLGSTLSVTAIWLLTVQLNIRTVENHLLRRTIKALLEQKETHPENQ
mgnify:CR=1 FL=1